MPRYTSPPRVGDDPFPRADARRTAAPISRPRRSVHRDHPRHLVSSLAGELYPALTGPRYRASPPAQFLLAELL